MQHWRNNWKDEVQDMENDSSEHNEMTPFFVALNLNQFELASVLAPDNFNDLNTCEYCLLIDKLTMGINPLVIDTNQNKERIKLM
jgi:hypothetical protein